MFLPKLKSLSKVFLFILFLRVVYILTINLLYEIIRHFFTPGIKAIVLHKQM